jgi:hypothetical protein
MKERPIIFNGEMVRAILDGRKSQTRRVVRWRAYSDESIRVYPHECPYGVPGDRLWVRETFCIESSREVGPYDIRWKATDPTPELEIGTGEAGAKWSPSIHMPRWASRITLEIVNVRVERVQEITETGAILEGVDASKYEKSYRYAFTQLWDSINAKRGFGWDANPWVWVLEFKKVEWSE